MDKLNILIIAPRFPFPLDKGDRLTIYHMLRYFHERGHTVSLVCFLEADQDPAWVSKISDFCKRVEVVKFQKVRAYINSALGVIGEKPLQVQYYRNRKMKKVVQKVIAEEQPNLLYAHTIRMGQYINNYTEFKRILAMQISMTLNYKRLAEHPTNIFTKFLNRLEYNKLKSYEAPLAHQFDKALLISKYDLKALVQEKPLTNVFFSPHGVDFKFFAPNTEVKKEENTIIFTGNMGYEPNVDAALYFSQEIFPRVLESVPEAKLYIVGTSPAPNVQALDAHPQITVTGRVPDLREYMNKATVAIDPLRVGAGLQNKVLEGMSMGLPMVITSVANEGIQAIPDENILIGDDAMIFANAVIKILQEKTFAKELGVAARRFIIDFWSWEKHFGDLEEMYLSLFEEKG